jgi:hypothetical protein
MSGGRVGLVVLAGLLAVIGSGCDSPWAQSGPPQSTVVFNPPSDYPQCTVTDDTRRVFAETGLPTAMTLTLDTAREHMVLVRKLPHGGKAIFRLPQTGVISGVLEVVPMPGTRVSKPGYVHLGATPVTAARCGPS